MKLQKVASICLLFFICCNTYESIALVVDKKIDITTCQNLNSHQKLIPESILNEYNYFGLKPEESSYFASRNITIKKQVCSSARTITFGAFKFIGFGDFEYEPFITTRQMNGYQAQQIYLFPAPVVLDAKGRDLNAAASFQMSYMHLLFGALIECPQVFNAKAYVDFISEFYGPLGFDLYDKTTVNGINSSLGLALQHAAIYLNWEKNAMIFGKSWHPMVDPEIQVSNQRVTTIGSPAEELVRYFQFRFTQKVTECSEFIFGLLGRLDDKVAFQFNNEPNALYSVPQTEVHLQFRTRACDHIFATGLSVITDKPQLFDDSVLFINQNPFPAPYIAANVFKSDAHVTSCSGFFFGKLAFEDFEIRAKALVGSNISQGISSYGVTYRTAGVDNNGNPIPPQNAYTAFNITQILADISRSSNKNFEPGIFCSFTRNFGANKPLAMLDPNVNPINAFNQSLFVIYGLEPNLDYTLIISPRVKYHRDIFSLCGEIEYYRASYGTIGCKGAIIGGTPVYNLRFILSVQAYF